MSRRSSNMNHVVPSTSAVDRALSLAHLSEYAHTLDSLPIDLSRNYGDLRELDAVLSTSMTLLTGKINDLISMIETKNGTNDERLFLLSEIAEEAGRLKLGGEDKIRVACLAADGLRMHKAHMKALLDRMPEKEFSKTAEALSRKTVYPHVATRNFYPPGMAGEGGRRNRRAAGAATNYGALLANGGEASPGKRKRAPRDEDVDVTRTPTKKERADPPAQRRGNGGRKKAADRVASPAESVQSAVSHLPQSAPPQSNPVAPRQGANARAGSNGSTNKRTNGEASSRREAYNAQPPAANHPSLPAYVSNQPNVLETPSTRAVGNGLPEWPHGQLEGPGMPVARNFQQITNTNEINDGMGADPDGDPEDNKTYCFCDGVSYGQMIGCDDEDCEREWFHLACVGLTVVPEGAWRCSQCLDRRSHKKTSRTNKKRTAGGRAAARNHAT